MADREIDGIANLLFLSLPTRFQFHQNSTFQISELSECHVTNQTDEPVNRRTW